MKPNSLNHHGESEGVWCVPGGHIQFSLGLGNILYLFVLLHGCFLGSVHKKIDLRHTADLTFLNLGLSRTNKKKTNTASCSGWT